MNEFLSFLKSYGLWGLLIVAVAYGLTEIIKVPIKKRAEAWADKNGVDKSVITKWLFVIPIVLSFAGSMINVWGLAGWGSAILSSEFDWVAVTAETTACGTAATAIYAIIENFTSAAVSKSNAKYASKSAAAEVAVAKVTIANAAVTVQAKAREAKKLAKREAKVTAEATRKAEAAKKAEEKRLSDIAECEAKLNALKSVSSPAKPDDSQKVKYL